MRKLLTLSLVLFSAISLTACTIPGTSQEDLLQSSSDTSLDNRLFKEASQESNAEKCDQILDESEKKECKKVVEANDLSAQAIAKMDKSICDDIELERYKEACKIDVEKKLQQAEQRVRIADIMQEAVDSKDPNLCDTIPDENQKYSCRFNILANMAIEEGNPSLCEQIGEQGYTTSCIEVVSQIE
ncbi:hypothetical protein KJ632_05310 [Patescibacteria group bacterium]|nr:hypothetical protein [Patescibacteria group bacterium]